MGNVHTNTFTRPSLTHSAAVLPDDRTLEPPTLPSLLTAPCSSFVSAVMAPATSAPARSACSSPSTWCGLAAASSSRRCRAF